MPLITQLRLPRKKPHIRASSKNFPHLPQMKNRHNPASQMPILSPPMEPMASLIEKTHIMKRLLPFFILPSALVADPVTLETLTIGSRTYESASISLETPQTALIRHTAGTARVPATSLPTDLQKQIGFDPAAAEAFRKKQAAKATIVAAIHKEAAAWEGAPEKKFEVFSNTPAGLLVWNYLRTTRTSSLSTGMSRVGGGGGQSFTSTEWEPLHTYSFIPHTAETRQLTAGQKFFAKALDTGSKRMEESEEMVTTYAVRNVRRTN